MTDARSAHSPPPNQTPLPLGARRDKSGRLLGHTVLGDPSEFETAWAKANPVRRNYTSHTGAGSHAHSGAPHTAHTQHTALTGHSLAAATLPTTAHSMAADGGGLGKSSWSEGSEQMPQVSAAEAECVWG